MVYNLINTTGSGNSVDLTHPEHSVIVEVCMDIMLFSIVPKFREYKRYNLSEANQTREGSKKSEVGSKWIG